MSRTDLNLLQPVFRFLLPLRFQCSVIAFVNRLGVSRSSWTSRPSRRRPRALDGTGTSLYPRPYLAYVSLTLRLRIASSKASNSDRRPVSGFRSRTGALHLRRVVFDDAVHLIGHLLRSRWCQITAMRAVMTLSVHRIRFLHFGLTLCLAPVVPLGLLCSLDLVLSLVTMPT